MKRMILFILLLTSFFVVKINGNDDEYIKGSKSGILIEEKTKTILYEKNIHEKLPPASMTKIMTMLLVFEGIANEIINFDTILTTSEEASSMGGTQVYLKVGEKITVHEALKCVAIASANDCAVLLAESISGSEKEFVKKMNSKAKELGANNTHFSDCSGLSDNDHYTTSYDLALISIELVTKYPKVFEYTNIREDYIRKNTESPFWLVNTNKLIGKVDGIYGLKTGHTSFAGYCITLFYKKENISLISIVFGYDTSPKRNNESLELLRFGANNYKLVTILSKGTTILEINHILYKEPIKLIICEDICMISKRNENNNYNYKFDFNIKENNGKLTINDNNQIIIEKELKALDVEKKNFFELVLSIMILIVK